MSGRALSFRDWGYRVQGLRDPGFRARVIGVIIQVFEL